MIKDFGIRKFRLFEEIELKSLSNVNLFVGRNNAGKSALLEAFLVFFVKMDPAEVINLLMSRQEHWDQSRARFSRRQAANPIRHFFKRHRIPEIFDEGFKLSSSGNYIHVTTAPYVYEESELRMVRRMVTKDEISNYDPDFLDKYLVVEEKGNMTILMSLDDEIRDLRRRATRRFDKGLIPCQFVPTQGISDGKASLMWDSISLTDLEKEVVKGLQLVEPGVTGLAFVDSGERSDGRIPLVKISNVEEPVPLKSLGDGMSRVFQIILSLVCAKDGILIVDEFENGLHWSVQEDVWAIVFETSQKLNVQVFCSTHSRDCISGFQKTWVKNPGLGSFARVYKENGIASIKEYDLELLSESVEMDVEVR